MSAPHLQHLAALIANDGHAASFQSLGQYRTALLKEIAQASAAPEQEPVAWAICHEPGKVHDLSATYSNKRAANAHVAGYRGDGCPELHITPLYTHAEPSEVAQLRAENARLTNQRDAILLQARVWAGEAKTQQAITREVGEILGGIPSWGPIAAGVEAMRRQLAEARDQQEKQVPLYEAINWAAGVLPEGWSICLNIERDGGCVELFDETGNQIENFASNNERLDYTVNDAVEHALEAASGVEGGAA